MAKRKISKKEELAYKLLQEQTRGREFGFDWFKYDWESINIRQTGYNRHQYSCNNSRLTVDTRQLASSFPEYLELANNLNNKIDLMKDSIDEINKLRQEYLDALFSHIKDRSKIHLEYELFTEEEEKLIEEYKSDPIKSQDLLNKIHLLSNEIDALPKGKANAEKKKELQAQLSELQTLFNVVKG